MTRTRDASTDPLPEDFRPLRHPDGHPDALMAAQVGTPEYQAAADARRATTETPNEGDTP